MNDAPSQEMRPRQFSLWTLFGFTSFIVVFVASCGGLLRYREWRVAEQTRQREHFTATLERLAKETEAVRSKLGRAPENQKELESLLRGPLPQLNDGESRRTVLYHQQGKDAFRLVAPGLYSDLVYESWNPKAGWQQYLW